MINLVTKSDLDNYKYVADSIKNHTTWTHFVSETQMLDIKNWLGDGLLLELINQASTLPISLTALNQKLLDGGTYVYQTRNFHFQGLKACIIYYAFARFTNRTSFNYTAAGIVLKDSDLSTPATAKDIQRLETENRLIGDSLKCEVITYLNRNYMDYPLWRDSAYCSCSARCSDNRPFKVIGD
jgi:hypothetical protein